MCSLSDRCSVQLSLCIDIDEPDLIQHSPLCPLGLFYYVSAGLAFDARGQLPPVSRRAEVTARRGRRAEALCAEPQASAVLPRPALLSAGRQVSLSAGRVVIQSKIANSLYPPTQNA